MKRLALAAIGVTVAAGVASAAPLAEPIALSFRQYKNTESIGKEFPPTYVEVNSGTTFRARWRGQLSNTIDYRKPLSVVLADEDSREAGVEGDRQPSAALHDHEGTRHRAPAAERRQVGAVQAREARAQAELRLRRRDELRGDLRDPHPRLESPGVPAREDSGALLSAERHDAVAFVRLFAGGLAALAVAAGVDSAASQPATRIIDRTMLCKAWGSGYPDPLRTLAVVGVSNQAQATNGPQGSPRFVVAQIALGVNGQDQVVVSRTACAPTSTRLQLSAKGLRSGVTEFGNKWKCPVPASVLIRVRAAFARPVRLEPAPDASYLLIARGRVSTGSLAVVTKDGTPVVFASVDKDGEGGLFVARPRCQRNRF
jgi:hypothetical protein